MKKEYIKPISKVKEISIEGPICFSTNPTRGTGVQLGKEDWFSEDEEGENDGSTPIYTYNVWEQPDKQ